MEEVNTLKAQVYDILTEQAELQSQYRLLERSKQELIKKIAEQGKKI